VPSAIIAFLLSPKVSPFAEGLCSSIPWGLTEARRPNTEIFAIVIQFLLMVENRVSLYDLHKNARRETLRLPKVSFAEGLCASIPWGLTEPRWL
jgi:hypothetical protein